MYAITKLRDTQNGACRMKYLEQNVNKQKKAQLKALQV